MMQAHGLRRANSFSATPVGLKLFVKINYKPTRLIYLIWPTRTIFVLVVLQPRVGWFVLILPSSSITAAIHENISRLTYPLYALAGACWQARPTRRLFRLWPYQRPRAVPVLPEGTFWFENQVLVCGTQSSAIENTDRRIYSTAVLLLSIFSQSAIRHWLGGLRTV